MLIVLLCRDWCVYIELALLQVGNEFGFRAIIKRTYEIRPAYRFQFCVGQICCKLTYFVYKLQSGNQRVVLERAAEHTKFDGVVVRDVHAGVSAVTAFLSVL